MNVFFFPFLINVLCIVLLHVDFSQTWSLFSPLLPTTNIYGLALSLLIFQWALPCFKRILVSSRINWKPILQYKLKIKEAVFILDLCTPVSWMTINFNNPLCTESSLFLLEQTESPQFSKQGTIAPFGFPPKALYMSRMLWLMDVTATQPRLSHSTNSRVIHPLLAKKQTKQKPKVLYEPKSDLSKWPALGSALVASV